MNGKEYFRFLEKAGDTDEIRGKKEQLRKKIEMVGGVLTN